ncbi:hypothetical protein IWX90DRAFT_221122 [Phyllosticta citrichinensis]|uniref:Secreted protein n=1 Tax=Phyllosticta citrichinensis TaxID=1130410 RepID=A0ABR1XUA8_9PEZI
MRLVALRCVATGLCLLQSVTHFLFLTLLLFSRIANGDDEKRKKKMGHEEEDCSKGDDKKTSRASFGEANEMERTTSRPPQKSLSSSRACYVVGRRVSLGGVKVRDRVGGMGGADGKMWLGLTSSGSA